MNQFNIVQRFYNQVLQKIAEESSITPDYKENSQEIALKEVESNKIDQRKELETLLEAARAETKADTKTMDKALPEATGKSSTTTSNPFVKIAMNMAFFESLRRTPHMKIASADYLKTIYTSFSDELGKIAP